MKPLQTIPSNRTIDQIENHYLVEKAIADKLKSASREERKLIYATMYDELFAKVPDHSRLTRRNDADLTQRANRNKLFWVREFLSPSNIFVEFAPGDCRFAMDVSKYVKMVLAIDISDQRGHVANSPDNFKLIIYDGYELEGIEEGSVDVIFSDQLIEHLHPEDTKLHFELANRILKPGGVYVFRTPHAFTGPHDISKYFSDEPQGFHLKEWTHRELQKLLRNTGFSRIVAVSIYNGNKVRLPYFYIRLSEQLLKWLSRSFRRALTQRLIGPICIVAIK